MLLQALCSISYPLVNSNWSYSLETPNLGQIRRFLVPCDLQIWRMTLKNNRAPLLCHFKLCVSFHTHWWIQIWDTVRKRSIRVKIISYPLVNSNLSYSPETPNLGQMRRFLEPCDLEIWWMTLKNNRAPLLCYVKLYVSFHHHMWIRTGVTVRKCPIWVKFDDF